MVDCGRRWGKTLMGQDLAIEVMLYGYPVGWFAPEYKYLYEVWDFLNRTLDPIITRSNQTERIIQVQGGGSIEMWSLDKGDAGRSRKYARTIIDEAGLVPGLNKKWAEDIRPTLTDLRGDAWFLSTPKGRNDFYQLWLKGQDPLDAEWASWQMPTATNPFIHPDEIEAARKGSVERVFQQEYLAEFLEDSAVFRKISEAATARPQRYSNDEHDPEPRHEYVVGVDWGKVDDYSVFTVVDATLREACFIDRSNRIDYTVQVQRLEALCRRFNVKTLVAEGNAQETTMELLRRTGLPVRTVMTTNLNKQNMIENLMLAFEQGDLKIIPDPVLLGELRSFESSRTPSGLVKYSAPEGYHDDCVMSLALAWDAVRSHNAPIKVYKKKRRR